MFTKNLPSNSHKGSNQAQKSGKGTNFPPDLEIGSGNQAGSSLTKRGSNVKNKKGSSNPNYSAKTGVVLL